jgi:hypothetical protein
LWLVVAIAITIVFGSISGGIIKLDSNNEEDAPPKEV